MPESKVDSCNKVKCGRGIGIEVLILVGRFARFSSRFNINIIVGAPVLQPALRNIKTGFTKPYINRSSWYLFRRGCCNHYMWKRICDILTRNANHHSYKSLENCLILWHKKFFSFFFSFEPPCTSKLLFLYIPRPHFTVLQEYTLDSGKILQ